MEKGFSGRESYWSLKDAKIKASVQMIGFNGKLSRGGTNNEENPLVFVELGVTNYFHFKRRAISQMAS